jgi:hypothetical protein
MSQFPRTPARVSEADRAFNERLARVQSKMLHAAELMTEKMIERYAEPPEPEQTPQGRRRAMANVMQIWRRCPQKTCRRVKACVGEPAHCLNACFPGLPPGYVAAYVAQTRRRKKR